MCAYQGMTGPGGFPRTGNQSGSSRGGKRQSDSRLPFRSHSTNEDGFPLLHVLRGGRRGRGGGTTVAREGYLSDLLSEQARLHKSIVRQSKLLKVDRLKVQSVDNELHRQITNEIVRVSAVMASRISPGQYTETGIARDVAPDQMIFDQMYSRQGVKHLEEKGGDKSKTYSSPPQWSIGDYAGRRWVLPISSPHLQLLRLEGPALRLYLKALERGYRGGPNQWLRSKYARQALPALARKGLIGPIEKRDLSVFSPKSPLRYWLRQCTDLQCAVQHGFHGERLVQYGSLSVLARQKKCGKLPISDWPMYMGRRLWPSVPTLFESWQQVATGSKNQLRLQDHTVKNHVNLVSVRDNPELAKRIARHNVIGIRAWIPVPEKLRWYFKYRWGFLILRRQVPLSIGVARFVLSLWKRAPMQCFLLHHVPLRYYLKFRMPTQFVTETAFKDKSLNTLFMSSPEPHGDEVPDRIRPFLPMRFLKSIDRAHRLEKGRGGVRLT